MPKTNAHRACDNFRATSESGRRSMLGEGSGITRRQIIGRGVAA
ncbi:MAG: hypothetical protein QOC95_992, partial [Thermoleophilaceae bacterium]|nr:hypothetical protein [Thermoleophilaceae bacterium]